MEAPQETEQTKPNSDPIDFPEPISEKDQTAVVGDAPSEPAITQEQLDALRAEAGREDLKRDFVQKVMAARAKQDEPEPAPPPLAPRIASQTAAEIKAGKKMNAHHAALAANRPIHPPHKTEGKVQAVFRPGDYVPDQKKGQGNVQARNL